jgi:VIT1/CCC1 family predicted Fe2+/Mn2+ transporter
MTAVQRWHTEKQSAWLYRVLAQIEKDPARSAMFDALAQAAEAQAAILRVDVKQTGKDTPPFSPSLRAIAVASVVRRAGIKRALPLLAALKVRGLSAYGSKLSTSGHPMPRTLDDVGTRHVRRGKNGVLRAGVFGFNDGLVSNMSLILGVAGASETQQAILLTGIAGLLAGAFSMAAGEYISMRSQRELFEHQIGEEREELERYPAEEAEELALIYQGRGVPLAQARELSSAMLKDKDAMLDTLAREELGLNPDELGSPWGAAISSFIAFALGAIVPLVPFFLHFAHHRVMIASAMSAVALIGVGATLSLFSGKNALYGAVRMLLIGSAAGAATYGIGRMIGVAIS